MSSVTSVIKNVQQPWGGYIRPKTMMKKEPMTDDFEDLSERIENIHPSVVGTSVDYLTRYYYYSFEKMQQYAKKRKKLKELKNKQAKYKCRKALEESFLSLMTDFIEAFKPAWLGIEIFKKYIKDDTKTKIDRAIEEFITTGNIKIGIKLASFDVWYRNPVMALMSDSWFPMPDGKTILLVTKLVKRNLSFFEKNPISIYGFTFPEGYTEKITKGDGDFITNNTLWDLKVSTKEPNKDHSLQILIYWRMGLHSIHKEEFEKIEFLGIVNPRLNSAWTIAVKDIPQETIEVIDRDVIGYQS